MCRLTDTNAFQISVSASNSFVSIAPYSVTCCIAMGKESCKYVLNAILWTKPLLFFGLILDLGLKYLRDSTLCVFLVCLDALSVLPLSLKHRFLVGVRRGCDAKFSSSVYLSMSIITVSVVHNSPNTSLAPAHASVIVIDRS